MPSQLPADCLYNIFEYLEDNKVTLHSCLLVDSRWCIASVKIFWRDISKVKRGTSLLRTLVACLSSESKDLLHGNGIVIPAPTPRPLLFNYASFCRVFSLDLVYEIVKTFLKNQRSFALENLKDNVDLVVKELLKMFINQVFSIIRIIQIK
jgi:hypothetical protein